MVGWLCGDNNEFFYIEQKTVFWKGKELRFRVSIIIMNCSEVSL